MYSPASVKPLSKAQLSKLLKGKPVRVMAGSGMKLHLSKPQHKKLTAAGKKGCGMNLTFDPYQMSMHAKGGDIWEDMLDGLTKAGKKLLTAAPEIAEAVGAPQLVAPINYLVDKYVADKTGEAEKSRKRAEEAKKPAVEPAPFVVDLPAVPRRRPKPAVQPAPFVVDLPAVPRRARRSRGGNIMEDFGDASSKFILGLDRDLPSWLKGPEKDPLGFLYGKGKKGKKGGRLLIDEPITTRQVVNQVKDFVTDPLGTLGFGLKRKVSKKKGGAVVLPQQLQDMGMAHINRVVPKEVQDLGLSALKQIGMGKPRKPMSDKQKAALAKGRAALAAKRGGAAVHPKHGKAKHKKMSGSALFPAGYKGSSLMPAGF
jgi:hypothetical protein